MARGYYTTKISDHREETPEGFLIARDTVLARSGWQTYAVKDLPQDSARDMGVNMSNPHADIDLYRRPEDVFRPETLASFEGKPIADGHPPNDIDPNNFNDYARGHIQNVRKGKEPLDSGDWPMIGDVHITAEPLLSKVRNNQVRELSLGYDYAIEKDGDRICQTDIIGNHCAVVPKGRAGNEASIGDSAPEPTSSPPISSIAPPANNPEIKRAATSKTSTAVLTNKEKKPVADIRKNLLGRMLKAFAADAEPEDVAEAAEVLKQPPLPAEDKKARDRKARDNELMEEDDHDEEAAKRKARDRKLRDAELDEEDEPVMDGKRKAMHDALDDLIDQEEAGDKRHAKDRKVNDADLEELKSLLCQFFSEEEKEPAHASDEDLEEEDEPVVDAAPLDEVLGNEEPEAEDEDPEELEEEEGAEDDDLEEGEEDLEPVGDKHRAKDRARAADGAAAVLKMMRPVIARCKDSKVQDAFNSALSSVTRSSRASSGGYGSFAGAARARDSKLPRAPLNRAHAADSGGDGADKRIADMQAAYDAAHNAPKGGK
jgi:hypothetical protein